MVNLLDKRAQNWLEDTQVDHIIPSILGGKVPILKNLLSKAENLQLLHKQCHKIKTSLERKNFINLYRQTRVSINNTPIKSMDSQTLELVTTKTLIKLYENYRLDDVLKLEPKDARRLERMYQVAKKKLEVALTINVSKTYLVNKKTGACSANLSQGPRRDGASLGELQKSNTRHLQGKAEKGKA